MYGVMTYESGLYYMRARFYNPEKLLVNFRERGQGSGVRGQGGPVAFPSPRASPR